MYYYYYYYYLLPSSCHPPHICKNIPYSQAIRLRRICSSDTLFQCNAALLNWPIILRSVNIRTKLSVLRSSKLPLYPAKRLLSLRRRINSTGSLLSRLIILISSILATLFVSTCLFSIFRLNFSMQFLIPQCLRIVVRRISETFFSNHLLQWRYKDSCLYPLRQALQGMRLCS